MLYTVYSCVRRGFKNSIPDCSNLDFFVNTNNSVVHRDEIVRFDPVKNTWRQLGKLLTSRPGHGVIQVDDDFIVVNGHSWTYSYSGKNIE